MNAPHPPQRRRRLLFAVIPPVAAAAIGGAGARHAGSVYSRLVKPAWAPPASVFGPVWSGLYASIAIAGWRLYPRASWPVVGLHLTQLGLNAAWPATFFERADKKVSIGTIAALDATLAAEVFALHTQDRVAGRILLPYLGWSLFATALNSAVEAP